MIVSVHKAIDDEGGVIGNEISSGVVGEILPNIKLSDQENGVVISRKFYLKNTSLVLDLDVVLTLEGSAYFSAILFESTGDAQVVGDLTGSEVNESPITVSIPSLTHKSFWLQITVPTSSEVSAYYNTVDVNLNY